MYMMWECPEKAASGFGVDSMSIEGRMKEVQGGVAVVDQAGYREYSVLQAIYMR